MPPAVVLCAGDLAHGIVEGQAEHLNMEVNGVPSQITFEPAPVTVFDDEAGIGGQNKIARLAGDELLRLFLAPYKLPNWHRKVFGCLTALTS